MSVAMDTQETETGELQIQCQPWATEQTLSKTWEKKMFSSLTVSTIMGVHHFHVLVSVALVILVGKGKDLRTPGRCILDNKCIRVAQNCLENMTV